MISSYAKKAKKLNQVFAAVAIIAVVGSGGSRLYSHVQPSLTQMLAKSNAQQEETKKAKYNDNNPKLLAQAMEAKKQVLSTCIAKSLQTILYLWME